MFVIVLFKDYKSAYVILVILQLYIFSCLKFLNLLTFLISIAHKLSLTGYF